MPGSLINQYTYTVFVRCDTGGIGTNIYINNQFVKQITSYTDTIPVSIGENVIKLSKFGYVDSLITIDSAISLNISLQLIPHSYSSNTDSNIIDFTTGGYIQYRKSVTVMDTALQSVMSLKQYDDGFTGMGLLTITLSTLVVNENDSIILPLSTVFSDPDSVHNDMTYTLDYSSHPGLSLSINNSNLVIHANNNYLGSTSLNLSATHDWLTTSNVMNVKVIPNTTTLKVTPNPNKGEFTVDLLSKTDEQATITINNILGQKVKEVISTTNVTIDILLNQPAGIYILSATTAHGKYVSKITIE